MWAPALSAILTQWMFRGSIRDFGWRVGPKKYLVMAALVPLIYAVIIYGISWAAGMAGFRSPALGYLVFLPVGFLAACLAALGEEIGWRGLLVPELAKVTTFTKTYSCSRSIIIIPQFSVLSQPGTALFRSDNTTISVLGLSCFCWLRLKSGSRGLRSYGTVPTIYFIHEVFLHMSTMPLPNSSSMTAWMVL
jgi:hypothetical protein